MSWQDRVKQVVSSLCRESYLQSNTKKDGKLYKKHRPYSVPDLAIELIDCLNRDDEKTAKSIMLYSYDVRRVTS